MSFSGITGAIFCVYDVGSLHNAVPLAMELRRRGSPRVLLIAGTPINGWQEYSRKAEMCGVKTVYCETNAYSSTQLLQKVACVFGVSRPQHLAELDAEDLCAIPPPSVEDSGAVLNNLAVKKQIRRRLNALRTALTVIDMLSAEVIFLGQDNLHFDTALWVKAIHHRGGVAIMQSLGDTLSHASLDVLLKLQEYVVHDALGETVSQMYPTWLAKKNGARVLRMPPAEVVALEVLELAPPHPWVFNSSHCDAVCINGEHARKNYRKHGFIEEHTIVTGHASMDALHECIQNKALRRSEFCEHLHLDVSRPLALCLLPNNKTLTKVAEAFGGDHIMLGHLLGHSLTLAGWNVVLCPHPAGDPSLFPFFKSPDWRVVAKPALELLPMADMCVGYGSSVEYMARAMGLPCIVYEIFGKWLSLHDSGDCYFVVDTMDKLKAIASLLAQPHKREVITASAQKQAMSWAWVDGKATERILHLTENLLRQKFI